MSTARRPRSPSPTSCAPTPTSCAVTAAVAADDEYKDSLEHKPWRDRECDGMKGDRLLSPDGIRLYGAGEDCPPLELDLETRDPLLRPGGVVARYLAAARATEAAAERKAEAEAAAVPPAPWRAGVILAGRCSAASPSLSCSQPRSPARRSRPPAAGRAKKEPR